MNNRKIHIGKKRAKKVFIFLKEDSGGSAPELLKSDLRLVHDCWMVNFKFLCAILQDKVSHPLLNPFKRFLSLFFCHISST